MEDRPGIGECGGDEVVAIEQVGSEGDQPWPLLLGGTVHADDSFAAPEKLGGQGLPDEARSAGHDEGQPVPRSPH
jgi:hypothetical protein